MRSVLPAWDERSSSDKQAASQLLIREFATSTRVNSSIPSHFNMSRVAYQRVSKVAASGEADLLVPQLAGLEAPTYPTCSQNRLHSLPLPR